MNITVKALTPDLLDDYLFFFDSMVFTEHPEWSKCYCYSFHFTGPKEEWTKENNRNAVIQMINDGTLTGYLAYSEGKAVGWCNVNSRSNYQSLKQHYKLPGDPLEKVCSIACFLISPDFRRKGIAGILLEKIIEDYSLRDYDTLEAYPDKHGQSCENNYKGPMSLYKRNNFKIIGEYDNYFVVRKELK